MVLPLMRMVVLKRLVEAEDYEAFTARTEKVIDQFEGQDSYGAKINGKLTVSENVADLGGVAEPLKPLRKRRIFQQKNSSPTLLASGA